MEEQKEKNWYDKSYKLLLIPPLILLILSVVFVYGFYQNNRDIIHKDVSLTGGTTLSVFDSKADISLIENSLKKDFSDVNVREISDIQTGGQRSANSRQTDGGSWLQTDERGSRPGFLQGEVPSIRGPERRT